MLALPGPPTSTRARSSACPRSIDLPDAARQDPTWFRTDGETYGRDGCRVPIPWEADAPAYGFSPSGASWLPQPASWRGTRATRSSAWRAPPSSSTGPRWPSVANTDWGKATWPGRRGDPDILAFPNGDVTVISNTGAGRASSRPVDVLLTSGDGARPTARRHDRVDARGLTLGG